MSLMKQKKKAFITMEEKDDDHDMKHLAIKPNMRIYTM
jgi:hypothetical protein